MDQGSRRTINPNGGSGHSSSSHSYYVTPCDPWHSTPVKKKNVGAFIEEPSLVSTSAQNEGQKMASQSARSPPGLSPTGSLYTQTPSLSLPLLQDRKSLGEMESATIQRQRRELQLLISELKDRDQELNTMAAAHHKQLTSWEQDRQRVLTLEQRCARLEDELQKRNEVIRAVTKRVHVVEAREKEGHRELNSTQQQLLELVQKQQHASQHCHDLKEKNQSLNSTVMSLSAQLGSLQVRGEELSAMLRLKDKDVTEATNHIVDLSGRLREMEGLLKESRSQEARVLREFEEHKRRYREARHENTRLKEELQQQVTEGSAQREDIIRLKQEGQLLRRELALSGEGESWKDELLGLARSKQERTESELHCLRQVCENQQNDLQLLQLNLESTREALKQAEGQGPNGRGGAEMVSMTSQGTERGEGTERRAAGSVYRQALSRSIDPHPNQPEPPFPLLVTGERQAPQQEEESSVSGLTSDLTDGTVATRDLTAAVPRELLSHSTVQASSVSDRLSSTERENQNISNPRTHSSYTKRESSHQETMAGRESRETMDTPSIAGATGTLSRTRSPDQASVNFSDYLSTVSGTQSTSLRQQEQQQLTKLSEHESNYSSQETLGRASKETMATRSSLAAGTTTLSLSDRIASYRSQQKSAGREGRGIQSQIGVSGNNSGNEGSLNRTPDQVSISDRVSNYSRQGASGKEGRGTRSQSGVSGNFSKNNSGNVGHTSGKVSDGVSNYSHQGTSGKECRESLCEDGIGTNAGSLVERTESPECGCSSMVEGQTGPSSYKTASCGSMTEVQAGQSCGFGSMVDGQTGPSCRCRYTSEGQEQSEPSPSEAGSSETGTEAGPGAGMELLAVFNGGPETEDSSILLVDISPCNTCQGDLTCVYLDSPSPSSRSRRSLGPANDSTSPTTTNERGVVNGNLGGLFTALEDEDQRSSTNHLQRLLAESRQMVASLERTTLQPLCPSHSPASNCDAIISLSIGQNSGNSSHGNHSHSCDRRNHSDPDHHPNQSSTHTTRPSQTSRLDGDTPPRNTQPFQRNKEPGAST
ncbi:coiled-coil domain-containing protein 62 isoform X1 [Coregonus clupeaformis]|uniref:coiled-coil domain-containing protein 62 isoform X1 n=2 Tax=Coregonus clupeaformis TaxID=59861 RepID=UPI001BE0330F|nr:coiled-coil domain-containing protein 62 isoform X1 [Coregonus clupeaformis]